MHIYFLSLDIKIISQKEQCFQPYKLEDVLIVTG